LREELKLPTKVVSQDSRSAGIYRVIKNYVSDYVTLLVRKLSHKSLTHTITHACKTKAFCLSRYSDARLFFVAITFLPIKLRDRSHNL
jgi:hypothetical protein